MADIIGDTLHMLIMVDGDITLGITDTAEVGDTQLTGTMAGTAAGVMDITTVGMADGATVGTEDLITTMDTGLPIRVLIMDLDIQAEIIMVLVDINEQPIAHVNKSVQIPEELAVAIPQLVDQVA